MIVVPKGEFSIVISCGMYEIKDDGEEEEEKREREGR